ncbi:MAG: tetratricopeptide repeat protein [Oxalobacteraceae bacterium]|nr:tetratricopeptide repeat protein [Oxalobacteraceae bacterium]
MLAPSAKADQAGRGESLPNIAVSEQLIQKYLSAELSFQRGDKFAAYSTMMSLARSLRDPRLARRALEFAIAGSLGGEAVKAARLWREIAPQSEEATQAVVGLLISSGRIDEVKTVLAQQLAASSPEALPNTIALLQRQLARVQDRSRAYGLLRELLEPYGDVLDARLTLAQAAMVAGDRATALTEARAALAKHPSSDLVALVLAQIIEDRAESVQSLVAFLQKNPKSREVRLAYARTLIEQNKVAEAKAQFALLLTHHPDDRTTLYALGLMAAQAGEMREAESYLSKYIQTLGDQPDRERDSTQALLVLAQIAEDKNDTAAALKWLEKIEPDNQGSYISATLRRAMLLAKAKDPEAARALLQQAEVRNDDDRAKLTVGEAQLLRDAGRLDDALRMVADALELNKNNIDLLYEHAMLAERAKQFDLMERELRKLIKVAPDNQHAYNALGYSFADRNLRLQEAFDLISKANQIAPNDPYILDSLGWVEFRLGRLEQALKTLQRAYEIKADAEIAAHLGEVMWKMGRQDEAKKLWRSANDKDPKNETLKATLQRLQIKL